MHRKQNGPSGSHSARPFAFVRLSDTTRENPSAFPVRAQRLRGLAQTFQPKSNAPTPNYHIPRDKHIYSPLGTNQFRVLILEPETHTNDAIKCQLLRQDFNWNVNGVSRFEYEALSYTWGSDPVVYDISLNGLRFSVRPNLY